MEIYKKIIRYIAPCIHTRNDILASQNIIYPSETGAFLLENL